MLVYDLLEAKIWFVLVLDLVEVVESPFWR